MSSSFLFTSFGQSSPSCHFTFTQSYHRYLAARVTGSRGHCFPHLHISSPSPLHLQKSLHLHPKLPPVPGVHAARQGPLFSSSSHLHHLHLSTFKSHWALIITTFTFLHPSMAATPHKAAPYGFLTAGGSTSGCPLHIGLEVAVAVATLERGPADPAPLHFHLQHRQRCPPYLGGGPSDNSPVKSVLVWTASF